jgi:DMSO/TMAO reductase YedYZ molybdopterin-dependent catalytic subunit
VSIQERDDVEYVCIYPPTEGDEGEGFRIGYRGVTAIKIVKRHGPMDWIPYVEVYAGDHLHAEAAQHQCSFVSFKDASK